MLCYGAHSNLALLEHYGFALEDNPNDRVLLSPTEGIFYPSTSGRDANSGWADTAAQAAAEAEAKCYLRSDGRPSWQLLASLRLAALSKEQRRKLGHTAAGGEPVSDENEVCVAITPYDSTGCG